MQPTAPERVYTFPPMRLARLSPWILGGLALVLLACRHPAPAAAGTADTILPQERRTTWNPGIPGGIPGRPTLCATLSAAAFGDGTTDATSAIQSAIGACPAGQVVYLPART